MLQIAIALPCLLWLLLRFTCSPGPYELDSAGKGTFFPHLIMYSVFFYLLAGLSACGAYLAWFHSAGWGSCFLLFAMGYALLFNVWLAFNFEMYMQTRYSPNAKSPYTLNRYAVTLALAVSAILMFLAGVVLTATVMVAK